MSDPKGRVIDETSRAAVLERARCIGLVKATLARFPDEQQIRCVLHELIEDMEARRLVDIQEPANGNR